MSKLVYLLAFIFGFGLTVNGQETPYSSLKSQLGEDFEEPKVLFPFEFEGVQVIDAKIEYKFPFQKDEKDLNFQFTEFQEVKSSVFELSKVSQDDLIAGFESGIPEGFQEVFKKTGPENFCRMILGESADSYNEVYLLFGNLETAEVLYFKFDSDQTDFSEKLKIELTKALN